jgi:hypothetical protein
MLGGRGGLGEETPDVIVIHAHSAIIAALLAGSVALLGFGLDSLIELVSASTILFSNRL